MRRPFKQFRPIGPFSQEIGMSMPDYTVFFTLKTDEVIDTNEILELQDSIFSRRATDGGELYAQDISVYIEPTPISSILDPGDEKTYIVKVALTPTVQNQQDYFGLTNIMIDIIQSEVNNMFGATNVKDGYEIVAGDHT
jgi:hypothetical protein